MQFIDNPRFLLHIIKRNIWEKHHVRSVDEIYKRFRFLDELESWSYIKDNRASIARFSDGEINNINGGGTYDAHSDYGQPWSAKLTSALEDSLSSTRSNLLIACEPPRKFLAPKGSKQSFEFCWHMMIDTRNTLHKFLKVGQPYGHSHLFTPRVAPLFPWQDFLSYISIRDVVICTGNIHKIKSINIGQSCHFIEAGTYDAFSRIDTIESSIRDYITVNDIDKDNVLIMLSLGPTAAVLATKMKDFQVFDTGHIFKYAQTYLIEG